MDLLEAPWRLAPCGFRGRSSRCSAPARCRSDRDDRPTREGPGTRLPGLRPWRERRVRLPRSRAHCDTRASAVSRRDEESRTVEYPRSSHFRRAMMRSKAILGAWIVFFATANALESQTEPDGFYTVAQAERGRALYRDACAACHGPDLTDGSAAPLAGPRVPPRWEPG